MLNPKYYHKYFPGLIFLLTFIIYIKTLCPTVAPRDSGELITAAYTLGIAHPPGYPLFVLLGKLFSFIPWGSVAWRINLMSAFFASATVTIVYLIVLKLTRSLLASAVSSLLLAFSPIFWALAVVAEVFQLNAFFTALTIWLLLTWKEQRAFRWLLWFSFVYGLSLTNHHTMFLLAPGFLYFVWSTEKKVLFNLKNWFYLGGCFAIGLLPYLFLPLRSLHNPYLDWGDPQTLDRFIAVVTRRQFGSMRLDPALPHSAYTLKMIGANLKVYFGWLISNFIIVGFILGLAGAAINYIKNRKLFIFFSLLFLFSGLFFVFLAAYPFHQPTFVLYCSTILRRFMLPSFMIFALWVGWGLAGLQKYLSNKNYRCLVIVLLVILPLVSLSLHFKKADMSRYYYAADLVDNILSSLKPDSLIFANADTTLFSLWYMQGVEGKRPDVRIISSTPHKWRAEKTMREAPKLLGLSVQPTQAQIADKIAAYPSGLHFFHDLILRNLGKKKIYADLDDSKTFGRLFNLLAPNGLVFEFMKTAAPQAKLKHLEQTSGLWHKYQFRSPLATADLADYPSREILTFYAEGHNFAGMVYAMNKEYNKAGQEFSKALDIYPNYPSARLNLQKLRRLIKQKN